MRLDNQRRSSNIEDRRGMRGGGGGGMSGMPLGSMRGLGIRGIIIIGLILLAVQLFAPQSIKDQVFGALGGGQGAVDTSQVAAGSCAAGDAACDGVAAVLGSTEDVWTQQFAEGRLPNYGRSGGSYQQPVLVLFEGQVSTACGVAPSSVGPFYCPGDNKLYIDLSFYEVLANRLNSPGDFAQAYVIAHEVGHHIQNLIGSDAAGPQEAQNQHSVRVELQADCFAGVWGHTAQASLAIDDADLREATNAAHNIGDDALQRGSSGMVNPNQFTHGTSEQRMRWFRRGFDSGDARQCGTFQGAYNRL
jgi:predicted metalloprotease